jgi:hypothetical protein
VAEAAGLFLGQHDHLDGLLGKPLEHGAGPDASATNLSGLKGWVRGRGHSQAKALRRKRSGEAENKQHVQIDGM